jgi:hypothetical protein
LISGINLYLKWPKRKLLPFSDPVGRNARRLKGLLYYMCAKCKVCSSVANNQKLFALRSAPFSTTPRFTLWKPFQLRFTSLRWLCFAQRSAFTALSGFAQGASPNRSCAAMPWLLGLRNVVIESHCTDFAGR